MASSSVVFPPTQAAARTLDEHARQGRHTVFGHPHLTRPEPGRTSPAAEDSYTPARRPSRARVPTPPPAVPAEQAETITVQRRPPFYARWYHKACRALCGPAIS